MTGTELVVRGATLQDKIAYAEKLAASGLLPDAYRKQPANVLYATEYGEMLGLTPLAAINGLHIIEGKPTASAGMVSSLVRRAGHRLRSGYDAEKRVGWCEIVRHDDPDFTYRSEWTLQRAVEGHLVQIKDGKPYARDTKGRPKPWERFPQAMMKARAITECARDACEEALNGVHYTPEEMGADVDEAGEPIKVTSERADQPSRPATSRPSPAAGAASTAAAPVVDWEAEIAARAGNADALRELWSRAAEAEPDNSALLLRIADAGKAATAEQQPPADEPVDAEIVDDEPSAPSTPAPTEPEPAEPGPTTDESEPAAPASTPAPDELLDKIAGYLDRLRVNPAGRAGTVSKILGRQIRTSADITVDEGALAAEKLHLCMSAQDPAAALRELLKEPPATPAQLTAIAAALGEHGISARVDRLAVVGFLIGEPIVSTSQLTRSEAGHVLDSMARLAAEGEMNATLQAAREMAAHVVELQVDEIGPSLRYATAKVNKVSRSGGGQQSSAGFSGADDPWGSAPPADEPPF